MAKKHDILVVDDEADIRKLIRGILEDEGYKTRPAPDAKTAYAEIASALPDLVVLDIWLQGSEHDGIQILKKIKKDYPDLPVLMISGHGTIETAVSSIKEGAYDFIEKPFKSDRLLLMMRRALENASLKRENANLKKNTQRNWNLIGDSPAVQNVRQLLERVAPGASRVLITGEPGTGKEVVARNLHARSERADKPFVVLSCATLRPERFEQELFGVVEGEGIFEQGVLEQAHGGTLLLDEVADMPLETQGKIVRVLQEQNFQRVGSQVKTEVDVRVLASTNRDLEKEIADGKFRQDLFYRLNVVPLAVPPLREHRQDIPALVEYFSGEISRQSGTPQGVFSKEALDMLGVYAWPGNVRQLRNAVEWALIMRGNKKELGAEDLPPEISGKGGVVAAGVVSGEYMGMALREAREMFERQYLQAQVERFDGNVSRTAEFVGMERSALHRKLKSLQIADDKQDEAEDKQQGRAG